MASYRLAVAFTLQPAVYELPRYQQVPTVPWYQLVLAGSTSVAPVQLEYITVQFTEDLMGVQVHRNPKSRHPEPEINKI